jgi:putative membrane protein insertion efficiency factor
MRRFVKKFFLILIWVYQKTISPHFPACCRFRPTCSQYAYEAITKYGPLKGSFLALKRLLRCNPFFKGGYDPVP